MFGLCDANNFYASCERVFNPTLDGKPVIVLSNNDGSVIARSNEAKALGISMGQPFFQANKVVDEHKVNVFSSNYELYGDMSNRVMTVLSSLAPQTEIYSIDECFLGFPGWEGKDLFTHAESIRSTVRQWTGIPVSIGLGPTKTLAKAANKFAKKKEGIKLIREASEIDHLLSEYDVEDLWGIGRQYNKLLKANHIKSALDLKNMPDGWIKKHMTVSGLRLVYELRGISCLPLENMPSTAKKAICTSRSFGSYVTSLEEMEEVLSNFTFKCAAKLRKQKGAAGVVTIFIHTNSFKTDLPQYSNSRTLRLPVASDHTGELLGYVRRALRDIYRPGYAYKRAGVILTGIVPGNAIQQDLFDSRNRAKETLLMNVVDEINRKGEKKNTFDTKVKFALQTPTAGKVNWPMQRKFLSPCYTTRWEGVLKAS